MNEIDKLTIKHDLVDLAESYRNKKRQCEAMAASNDTIAKHKEYWLQMAERHEEQALVVDRLRESL